MRIFSSLTNQEAYLVNSRDGSPPAYDCYLQNRPNNKKEHAKRFVSIQDAAAFLQTNPGAGIRMNPGSAIVNTHIAIEA